MTASITKYEIFDRSVATRLLKEEDSVVTVDEKKLITKLLRKTNKNLLEVKYNYAKGYENLKVGRLYPAGLQSLGSMNGNIIRSPMCEKYYFDIDQVNAHYNIAYQYAERRGLECTHIKHYCENREESLNKVMEDFGIDRFDAKILFLKIAYGGNLPDDVPEMSKPISNEKVFGSLPKLKDEMDKLADNVWVNNVNWHDLSVKGRKLKESGPNKKFKMLSLFLQTEERKILEAMNKYFTDQGRSVDILIHDGCMIRKNQGELSFPRELMDTCQEFVKEYTSYSVRLEEKPIVFDWELTEEEPKSCTGFWKNHFVMNGKLYKENPLYEKPLVITSAQTYVMQFYEEFHCPTREIYEYISKHPERQYDTYGFYPYGKECPSNVYNTFNGFEWTKLYKRPGKLSNREYYSLIEEITEMPDSLEDTRNWKDSKTRWQIEDIICHDDDPEKKKYNIKYFINILGNRLFAPTKPCEKVLCLRNNIGGSGKTGLIERSFAEKLLGEEYFTSQSSASHIFGEFNASISSKLFVLCEEAETKDTKDFTANVKAAVTRKRNPIRLMRTDCYNEQNYCVYIANTNKQTAFEFDPKNHRRFPIIDCKEYQLSREQIKALREETENPYYNKLFFEYILRMYDPDFNFEEHPESESVKKLEERFKDPFIQFFEITLYHWDEFYNEKYRDPRECKKYNLNEKDEWEIKAEEYWQLFISISTDMISRKYAESIPFAAFRQNEHLLDLMKKYPKYFKKNVVSYSKKGDTRQHGTYYTINLKEFREFFNPEFIQKSEEPPAKKQKFMFDFDKK